MHVHLHKLTFAQFGALQLLLGSVGLVGKAPVCTQLGLLRLLPPLIGAIGPAGAGSLRLGGAGSRPLFRWAGHGGGPGPPGPYL